MNLDSRHITTRHRGSWSRPRGFTLLELLISVGIIIVLVGMVFLVGQSVIEQGKTKETRAMIAQANEALLAFKEINPYRSSQAVQDRYGPYLPDDLMAYTPPANLPANRGSGHGRGGVYDEMPDLMPGGLGTYVNLDPEISMDNITDDITAVDNGYVPHGSIKALVWGLRQMEESRTIYEAIPKKFKVVMPLNQEYFDVDGDNTAGGWGQAAEPLVDDQVEYLVDSWGSALSYYAARELVETDIATGSETAHGGVARMLVQANNGRPVIMSYGPDGEAQVQSDRTLEAAYEAASNGDAPFTGVGQQDNIFSDDSIPEKLPDLKKQAI